MHSRRLPPVPHFPRLTVGQETFTADVPVTGLSLRLRKSLPVMSGVNPYRCTDPLGEDLHRKGPRRSQLVPATP
jgi:hypothetical protein